MCRNCWWLWCIFYEIDLLFFPFERKLMHRLIFRKSQEFERHNCSRFIWVLRAKFSIMWENPVGGRKPYKFGFIVSPGTFRCSGVCSSVELAVVQCPKPVDVSRSAEAGTSNLLHRFLWHGMAAQRFHSFLAPSPSPLLNISEKVSLSEKGIHVRYWWQ